MPRTDQGLSAVSKSVRAVMWCTLISLPVGLVSTNALVATNGRIVGNPRSLP